MRALNVLEIASVSGGDLGVDSGAWDLEKLGEVKVTGRRIPLHVTVGRLLLRFAGVVGVGVQVGIWAWDNHVNSLQTAIDEREKEAKYNPNEIEEVVVEGHRQGNVMEDVDGVWTWTGRFWLDCDGDGKWDSQYFVDDNGVRWLDVTGNGQWHVVPDRADWRRGFHG